MSIKELIWHYKCEQNSEWKHKILRILVYLVKKKPDVWFTYNDYSFSDHLLRFPVIIGRWNNLVN